MNQQVIITLRGTAELKEMLVFLSKLRHESMNAVVAGLIRKEYYRVRGVESAMLTTQPEPSDYVPPNSIRTF